MLWLCIGGLVTVSIGSPIIEETPKIIREFPHDASAFVQGFQFSANGSLYESNGIYGQSDVRRYDSLVSFTAPAVVTKLAQNQFGEGLALVGKSVLALTWRERLINVFDADTLEFIRAIPFEFEGYGLAAAADGRVLFSTDGSAIVRVWEPAFDSNGYVEKLRRAGAAARKAAKASTKASAASSSSSSSARAATSATVDAFVPPSSFTVTHRGMPQARLNELEAIEGELWCNVWLQTYIVRIDVRDIVTYYTHGPGAVDAAMVAESGGKAAKRATRGAINGQLLVDKSKASADQVFNGIAVRPLLDPDLKRALLAARAAGGEDDRDLGDLFVTGKQWSTVYQIEWPRLPRVLRIPEVTAAPDGAPLAESAPAAGNGLAPTVPNVPKEAPVASPAELYGEDVFFLGGPEEDEGGGMGGGDYGGGVGGTGEDHGDPLGSTATTIGAVMCFIGVLFIIYMVMSPRAVHAASAAAGARHGPAGVYDPEESASLRR